VFTPTFLCVANENFKNFVDSLSHDRNYAKAVNPLFLLVVALLAQ
jgi:hypothetical protein